MPNSSAARARQLAEAAAIDHARGAWGRAELAARESLVDEPNPVAENVLCKLALEVGRPDLAIGAAQRAIALDPRFKPAARNLASAYRMLEAFGRSPPPDQAGSVAERYLVIREWGYGFWADVDQVIGSLLLAEITGRTPVVYWGPESLWAEPEQSSRGENAWTTYFEPVSSHSIAEIEAGTGAEGADPGVFPPKWSLTTLRAAPPERWEGRWSRLPPTRLLNRPERVVVSDFHVAAVGLLPWLPVGHRLRGRDFRAAHRDLFAKYLRPRPEVGAEAEAFVRERLGDPSRAVAVHIRGTDKAIESAHLERVSAEYPRRIDELLTREPGLRIFLMTDDAGAREQMESRFGDRVVCTDAARSSGSTGVHYLKHESRRRLGMDVLRDVLIAARCGRLIGLGSSNVTLAALHMKEWDERAVHLLDRPLHSYVSPVLFTNS